jgi:hypothetical protein
LYVCLGGRQLVGGEGRDFAGGVNVHVNRQAKLAALEQDQIFEQ